MKALLILLSVVLISCGDNSLDKETGNDFRKKQFVETMTEEDGLYFAVAMIKNNPQFKYIELRCKKVDSVTNQRKINHIVDLLEYLEDNKAVIRIGGMTLDRYHERKMLFKARRILMKDLNSIECPQEVLAKSFDYKKPKKKKD